MHKEQFYIRKLLAVTCTVLTLCGCEVIEYHPYDGRIGGETDLNRKNIERIESALADREQIRFAVISDTQRWFDEMELEVASINKRRDVDFVIHCGDQTDFGLTKEYELQRNVLQKLNMPFVVLLGNHDCIGSGKDIYRAMYGKENFSFKTGNTRFVCLDTNALEYDFSNPIPDLEFIRSFADDQTVTNTVPVMHIAPFFEEFNNNVADAFNYNIHKLTNPLFCLYGHGHSTEVNDLFGDGLLYYQITCAKYRQYYVFTIKDDSYEYEIVDY